MTRRLLAVLALVAGCNTTNIQTPTRSLDRPSDIALVCATWRQEEGRSRMLPLSACNEDDTDGGVPINDGAVGATAAGTLFALASNTNRGEVAMATTGEITFAGLVSLAPQLVDLDPNTPGFGFLPVGNSPDHMRATDDGCRAVTANTDGCDLAVVKVAELVATEAGDRAHPPQLSDFVTRVQPQVKGVPILSRPTWLEISPSTTDLGDSASPDLGLPGSIAACGAGHYKALVAFPGCELVAEVNLDTGELTRAVQVTRGGPVVLDLTQGLSCPVECSGFAVDGGVSAPTDDAGVPEPIDAGVPIDAAIPVDAAVPSDGGASGSQPPILPSTQAYPHTFAVADDGPNKRMLYIGDAVSPLVSAVSINDVTGTFAVAQSVTLSADALGAELVRISPRITDPSVSGDPGVRYLYVVARDGTIRVIDEDLPAECELNPDPAIINSRFPIVDANLRVISDPLALERTLRCLPVGAPGTPPRKPAVRTPGLSLPGGGLARDIAFVHVRQPPQVTTGTAPAANATLVVGDFAFIVDSNGHTDVVNIADRCLAPNDPLVIPPSITACDVAAYQLSIFEAVSFYGRPIPQAIELMPNQLRDSSSRFIQPANITDLTGSPRLTDLATVSVEGTTLDPFDNTHADLCSVPSALFNTTDAGVPNPVGCEPQPPAITSANFVNFRDLSAVNNETWSFSWEGALPGAIRTTGTISGTTLTDAGSQFCLRAVEPGDKVYLTGCVDDTGCGSDQQCFHDPGAPTVISSAGTVLEQGLCLPRDEARFADAQNTCVAWTRSLRRWSVTTVNQTQLALDELPEPEQALDTRACNVDEDCTDPANPVRVPGAFNNQAVALDTKCLPSATGKTCLRSCTMTPAMNSSDGICGDGYVCANSRFGDTRCLRAQLPPDPALDPHALSLCFGELEQYEVHAGSAFTVHGDTTVLPSPFVVDPATQRCVPSPDNPPTGLVRARLPITPPPCPAPVSSDWLATLPPGSGNACSLVPPSSDGTRIFLHFENTVFTTALQVPARVAPVPNLDGGLLTGDGGVLDGVVTHVPADDTVVAFTVVGGFHTVTTPIGVDVIAQMPRSVETAPDHRTLYIVDEGKQPLGTGLRGQLLRLFADTQTSDQTFEIH